MNVNIQNPTPDLFDKIAEEKAASIARPVNREGRVNKNLNKPTQLRRFYDELERWHSKIAGDEGKFQTYLPQLRMMNAKIAYAKGRNLIDGNYSELFTSCLRNVENVEHLDNMKLFMEALMGFLKLHRPKD